MFSLAFVCDKLLSAKKLLLTCAGEEEEEFIFTTSIANEEVQALEPHRVCASQRTSALSLVHCKQKSWFLG
jgi:hypothetical protein